MTSRIARTVALALPVLLVCVLVSAGGWRLHDGRVERVGSSSAQAAAPVLPATNATPSSTELSLVHHLSPSVPWPAWAALIVLCFLPAVASVLAWSGSRRPRDVTFSA